MGKRSFGQFQRRDRDAYPTPAAAVLPLIPHLRGIRSFAEPCCDNGDLVRHLKSYGLRCLYQGDIATGQDALRSSSYGAIDAIITNPPWRRSNLHPLISHFQKIAPTWLLIDQDWAARSRPGLISRAAPTFSPSGGRSGFRERTSTASTTPPGIASMPVMRPARSSMRIARRRQRRTPSCAGNAARLIARGDRARNSARAPVVNVPTAIGLA